MSEDTVRARKSMVPSAWEEARGRLLGSGEAGNNEYHVLAHVLDLGAEHLSELQALFSLRQEASVPVAHLLEFIDGDLTDLFRCIAYGSAHLLPGDQQSEHADPPEVQADVRLLVRYFAIAALAAENPIVPSEVRNVFQAAAAGLEGWGDEMVHAVQRVADSYLRPVAEANA